MTTESTQASPIAVASLVLGIVSVLVSLTGLRGLGFLAGIPAVICGHMARSRLKRDPTLPGKGAVTAGLVTGYIGIAVSFTVIAILTLLSTTSAAPFIYTFF